MPILKEIGIGSRGLDREMDYQLRIQLRHIAAMIERQLSKLKTPDFWKVLVLCCEKVPERNLIVIGGVLDVHVKCDLLRFFKLGSQEKKQFAFEAITKGLLLASEHTGIGVVEFKKAIEASRSLINEWSWPKTPASSPDRKWKAQLWCCHELEDFTAHLTVLDKQRKEVARDFVFKAPPSEFQFVPLMSAPEWLSATEIAVGDQTWHWDAAARILTKQR